MPGGFKEGDCVQVVDREPTSEDMKAALFFNHFRSLTGKIQKVYPDQTVAVEIDNQSLTEPILKRHIEIQETRKAEWLDKLSDEARNRLTDQERDFRLHYTILVAMTDLAPPGKALAAKPEVKPPAVKPMQPVASEIGVKRATVEDLDAAEDAEFQRRRTNREA